MSIVCLTRLNQKAIPYNICLNYETLIELYSLVVAFYRSQFSATLPLANAARKKVISLDKYMQEVDVFDDRDIADALVFFKNENFIIESELFSESKMSA